jgi:hypothetical protein
MRLTTLFAPLPAVYRIHTPFKAGLHLPVVANTNHLCNPLLCQDLGKMASHILGRVRLNLYGAVGISIAQEVGHQNAITMRCQWLNLVAPVVAATGKPMEEQKGRLGRTGWLDVGEGVSSAIVQLEVLTDVWERRQCHDDEQTAA